MPHLSSLDFRVIAQSLFSVLKLLPSANHLSNSLIALETELPAKSDPYQALRSLTTGYTLTRVFATHDAPKSAGESCTPP